MTRAHLTAASIPAELLDHFTYPPGFDALDGLVLYEPGFTHDDAGKPCLQLCHKCRRDLQNDITPALSMANDNFYGPPHPALAGLTLAERHLIAVQRCVVMITLHGHGAGDQRQRALKGHCICFLQKHEAVVERLPRPVNELLDTLKVCYIGGRIPSRSSMRWLTTIRSGRVRAALHALKYDLKHTDYLNIQICEDTLATLPRDDVPDCLWNTIVHSAESDRPQRTDVAAEDDSEDPVNNGQGPPQPQSTT